MIITTENYFEALLKINWANVPESLKKTRDTLIPDASRDDWKAYHADADIRRVVDKYFAYAGKYVSVPTGGNKGSGRQKSSKPIAIVVDEATKAAAYELADKLIRNYVLRGDSYEDLRKSLLGSSNAAGSASIRKDKIVVDKVGTEHVNVVFSLRKVYDAIKGTRSTKAPKSKKAAIAKTVATLPEPKQVTHIPTSTAFIKRYASLHGKVKSRDQIISLVHGLQKAITEQRIRKNNPAIAEIERMQQELIAMVTSMPESAKIEIDANALAHYKQIAQGEEVRTSVKLLRSFITMSGKAADKEKAAALHKRMQAGLSVIPKEDPYRAQLSLASTALADYRDGKSAVIGIPLAALHGLGSLAVGSIEGLGIVPGSGEGAVIRLLREEKVKNLSDTTLKKAFRKTAVPSFCLEIAKDLIRRGELTMDVLNNPPVRRRYGGLRGIETAANGITDLDVLEMRLQSNRQMQGLGSVEAVAPVGGNQNLISTTHAIALPEYSVSAQELARMRFKTIGYNGRFSNVVGDPAVGFRMMVYGKPYNGKSSFVIELCKELAALEKGRIAYLALEEGISLSMQKKVIERGADKVAGLEFKSAMPTSFAGYGFVVIDSVSDRSISREKLRELFLQNPQTSFICIFHATKAGSARGGLDFSHDMDIIIRIEAHKPVVEKNRFL